MNENAVRCQMRVKMCHVPSCSIQCLNIENKSKCLFHSYTMAYCRNKAQKKKNVLPPSISTKLEQQYFTTCQVTIKSDENKK